MLASGVYQPVALGSAAASMPPCEVAPPDVPTVPSPEAPTNLRLVGGSEDLESESEESAGSGPFVPEGSLSAESAAAAAAGPQDYYMSLASRSDCLRAWSLRSQAQLNSLVAESVSTFFTYDPSRDSYPNRQDAAKLLVANKSGNASLPTTQQVRMPQPAILSGTLIFTWDWYWGPEFLTNRELMNHYKVFKFQVDGHAWWTLMNSPAWAAEAPTTQRSVAKVWDSGPWSGGQPNGSVRREPWTPAGQGAPDQRKGSGEQVNIEHGKWYRYWVEVKLFQPHTAFTEWNQITGTTLQPQPSDPQGRWHMVSKWIGDENGTVRRILYRVPFGWSSNWSPHISRFDLEMNTSQTQDSFRGPMIGYGRNVVVLHNYRLPSVPESDTHLFQLPVR